MEPTKKEWLRIAVYLAGNTYPEIRDRYGDFKDWFAREITQYGAEIVTVDVREGAFPKLENVDGIIVTGSSASVCTDPDPWVGSLLAHLREILDKNIPMLGVCFGHQALAVAAGGTAQKNPLGREMGTVKLTLTHVGAEHPLFSGLSSPFLAQETHEDIVTNVPETGTVKVLARNGHSKYQALAYSDRAFSVQFHPEITREIMTAYLQIYGSRLIKTGELHEKDLRVLERNVRPTETGPVVLKNFVEIVRQNRKHPSG